MPVILGGNTGIYLASLTPAVDPDAQAFITAAAITDPTQQAAINNLVIGMKADGLWTKMKAVYPFVGGTSTSTSYNLKNTAQYQITWNGGITHSSTGVLPNGTNGYGSTGFFFDSTTALSSHISTYIRTNSTTLACEIGSGNSAGTEECFIVRSGSTYLNNQCSGQAQRINPSVADARGLILNSRRANNDWETYRNGSSLGTNTANNTYTGGSSYSLALFRRNGVGTNDLYSAKETAFASIGDGLTDTEAANFYTAVQAFQVALGRSIGTQTVSDADAQAFVTNAGIVDQVEANAINNLVIGMKADGLWTKMKAVYPFVGGSNTSNSYNLKNTAQFQISWAGGVTSSANGVTVVTNGYGNTAFNMSTQITSVNSWAVGVYVNQYTAGGIDLGADLNGLDNFYHSIKWDAFWGANTGRFSTNSALAFTDTNGLGLTVSTRNSALNKKVYKAGSEIANAATASAGTFFNGNVFLGALNRNGSASFYSGKRYAFAFICDGSLNATENTNLNTRVTTFQTTLNRL